MTATCFLTTASLCWVRNHLEDPHRFGQTEKNHAAETPFGCVKTGRQSKWILMWYERQQESDHFMDGFFELRTRHIPNSERGFKLCAISRERRIEKHHKLQKLKQTQVSLSKSTEYCSEDDWGRAGPHLSHFPSPPTAFDELLLILFFWLPMIIAAEN